MRPISPTLALLAASLGAALAAPAEVDPTGDAEGDYVAVSGTGDAKAGFVAGSGVGGAEGGLLAVSAQGEAGVPTSTNCLDTSTADRHVCTSGGLSASGTGPAVTLSDLNFCSSAERPECSYVPGGDTLRINLSEEDDMVVLLQQDGRGWIALGTEGSDARALAASLGGLATSTFVALSAAGPAEGGLLALSLQDEGTVPNGTNCVGVGSNDDARHVCTSGGVGVSGGSRSVTANDMDFCTSGGARPSCPHPSEDVLQASEGNDVSGAVAVSAFGDSNGTIAISLTGHASGSTHSLSACDLLAAQGHPELCAP